MGHASLPLDRIRTDGGTQPRLGIDYDVAYGYGDLMAEGVRFPPVTVFYDGENYWLADGFHRYHAAFAQEMAEIAAEVIQGTIEDAQWFSFGANKAHGLMRSNEDKQRAVKAALQHPKCAGLSDLQVAKHCGVSRSTVQAWRNKLEPTCQVGKSTTRKGADGRTINVANIGKKQAEPPPMGPPITSRHEPPPQRPTPEPAYRPVPEPGPQDSEELVMFVRHLRGLLETQLTDTLLADEITSSPFANQILNELERAHEFLTSIQACAAARR